MSSKLRIAILLLPLAGALQQMRLATSSTMAPHWQPKPAPAPLVDAPAAPALSVEAAMRIMFDPVGRGKVRRRAVKQRDWTDPMVASHVAFVPGIVLAAQNDLWELAALQSATLVFSLAYHRAGANQCTSKLHSALLEGVAVSLVELLTGERPGRVALAEGTLAKALFVYGLTQTTLNAPSPEYFAVEAPLAALCLTCFLATNFAPATYERWHAPGLHLCPGIWSAVVAAGHTPLLHMLL